jgi:hypothetical protein
MEKKESRDQFQLNFFSPNTVVMQPKDFCHAIKI